jgi:RNA polymerase sigma factor (sigma-70 family)
VAAVLAGDRRAFGALVDRHVDRATTLAQRLLGSRAEAEDVVQEATLQAYLGLRELREPERFGAWFSAIMANLAKMRLRETRARLVPSTGSMGVLRATIRSRRASVSGPSTTLSPTCPPWSARRSCSTTSAV